MRRASAPAPAAVSVHHLALAALVGGPPALQAALHCESDCACESGVRRCGARESWTGRTRRRNQTRGVESESDLPQSGLRWGSLRRPPPPAPPQSNHSQTCGHRGHVRHVHCGCGQRGRLHARLRFGRGESRLVPSPKVRTPCPSAFPPCWRSPEVSL